jgi:hypothetical protein
MGVDPSNAQRAFMGGNRCYKQTIDGRRPGALAICRIPAANGYAQQCCGAAGSR